MTIPERRDLPGCPNRGRRLMNEITDERRAPRRGLVFGGLVSALAAAAGPELKPEPG